MITDLEYDFLCACHEAVIRQQELVPLLAKQLGLPPEKVIYDWRMQTGNKQLGTITGTDWRHFFHGQECDLRNVRDGRFLRLDFGPNGRYDTFTGYGILQFVMSTRNPWREFAKLKTFLAQGPAPYSELSGSHQKMVPIVSRLFELCLVEVADRELCEIVHNKTKVKRNGSKITTVDASDPNWWYAELDSIFCFNLVLSASGRELLKNGNSIIAP